MDGIIYHTVQFCDNYAYEYAWLKEWLDRPLLLLETDYTRQSGGQVRTRIEAFLESLSSGRDRAQGRAETGNRTGTGSRAGRAEKLRDAAERGKKGDGPMYVMGIDSGSTSTNAVIMDQDRKIKAFSVVRTGAKSGVSAERALNDVLEKAGLTREDILHGAGLAFEGGWNRVKLYFMLGLPTETEEDIRGIAELSNDIAALYYEKVPKEKRTGPVQIVSSTSFFIPKPFTPFQWARMCTKEEFLEKAALTRRSVREQLNQKRIKYNWHEADVSVLEGVFARGDRRVADAILAAYQKGCLYDAWGEYFKNDVWLETFEQCGLDIGFYTTRERKQNEIFPWDFLDCGVSKSFLWREWERAQRAEVTPNCRAQCQGCGAARFGGGVCFEAREEQKR